jgi:hypothetical protein
MAMTVGEFLKQFAAGGSLGPPQPPLQPLDTTQKAQDALDLELRTEALRLTQDNRNLRKKIALSVGIALAVEIVVLFALVLFQGIGRIPLTNFSFALERWTFSIFTSAVLLQTFALANLIVRNLFPTSDAPPKQRKR